MSTRSSPKEALASRLAPSSASAKDFLSRTTRMPLPPPPAEGLISNRKPMRPAPFAIRILRNTLALPGRLALLEEGGDAFSSLGRGADLGDAPCRIGFQLVVDGTARHLADEVLDAR